VINSDLAKEETMKIDIAVSTIIVSVVLLICIFFFIKFTFYPIFNQYINASQIIISDGFTFKAGSWFDEISLTFPFVLISFGVNDMTITHSGADLVLQYNEITSVNEAQGLAGGKGVEIKHTNTTISKKIIIWTPYYNQVIEYLQGKRKSAWRHSRKM
jgi:hypothetical protein